jgi:hypothetical protein
MPEEDLDSLHSKLDELCQTTNIIVKVLQGDLESDTPGLKQRVTDIKEDVDSLKETQSDIKTKTDEMYPVHKIRKGLWATLGTGVGGLSAIELVPFLKNLFAGGN